MAYTVDCKTKDSCGLCEMNQIQELFLLHGRYSIANLLVHSCHDSKRRLDVC